LRIGPSEIHQQLSNTGFAGPDWNYYTGTNFQTVPGLTLNPMEEAFPLGPFAPAATSQDLDVYQGVLSFTGTIVAVTPPTVPEPSTLVPFAAALAGLGIVRATRILRRGRRFA
jgi:hypothetical protein